MTNAKGFGRLGSTLLVLACSTVMFSQVSRQDQSQAAEKAYTASAQEYNSVAQEATTEVAQAANIVTQAVEGAIIGTAGGSPAVGASAGALNAIEENAKDDAEDDDDDSN